MIMGRMVPDLGYDGSDSKSRRQEEDYDTVFPNTAFCLFLLFDRPSTAYMRLGAIPVEFWLKSEHDF
jgi:hypothetical protein